MRRARERSCGHRRGWTMATCTRATRRCWWRLRCVSGWTHQWLRCHGRRVLAGGSGSQALGLGWQRRPPPLKNTGTETSSNLFFVEYFLGTVWFQEVSVSGYLYMFSTDSRDVLTSKKSHSSAHIQTKKPS